MSPVPLEEQLDLTIDPALSAIDQVAAALSALATNFQAELAEALEVLSDTADEEVTLTVDTEGADEAQAELEATGLVAEEVDGQLVVVDVSAEGAEEAAAALEEVGDQSANTTAAAAAAGGSLDDLGASAQGAATGLLASALAIGGVSLGVSELFTNALDAEAGLQSFQARTGDAAEQVEQLTGASSVLADNLGDLAIALGSDDEELRSAVARLFALGEAEGFATDRTDALIEQVIDIGARARGLNPDLGSLGGIVDTLGTRLQRGGRFATAFGLSLNLEDILERAADNTGKLESELTVLEKTEAAAQLATEQLGGSLGEDIAVGAENAAISFDRLKTTVTEALEPLGAPLISPVFELLEAGGPLIETVAGLLADLGQIGVEAFTPILQAAQPVFDLFADAGSDILGTLRPAITDLSLAVADLITQSQPLVTDFTQAFEDAAPGVAVLVGLVADLTLAFGDLLGPIGRFLDAVDAFGSLPFISELTTIGNLFGDEATAVKEAQDAHEGLEGVFESSTRRALLLEASMLGLTDAQAEQAIAANTGTDGFIDEEAAMDEMRLTASQTVDEVEAVGEATEEAGGIAAVTASQWEALAAAILRGQVTSADYQGVADDLGVTLQEVEQFATGVTGAIDTFVSDAVTKIPTVTDVVGDLTTELQAQPDAIIAALQESEEAIGNFQTNVRTLVAFGLDDLARLAIERGPEFTNALVNTLRVGRPLLAQELEAQLEGAQTQINGLPAFFESIAPQLGLSARELAETASAEFGLGLTVEATTTDEIGRTVDAILRGGPALDSAGEQAGTQTTAGYEGGVDLPGATAQSASDAEVVLRDLGLAGSPLAIAALESGSIVGNSFAIGLGNAIVDAAGPDGSLRAQVESAINDLEAAAAAQFSFDLSASVTGAPAGLGGAGDFILSLGGISVTVQGGATGRDTGEAVAKGVEKGVVSAGRMLLAEVRGG